MGSCKNSTQSFSTDKDGNVVSEEFYKNKKIKKRIVYLNEKRSDYLYSEYYDNGVLLDSCKFVNRLVEGPRIYFDQSGDLLHHENYVNGRLHGFHNAVYSNGVSSFEGFRKNGRMVGEWEFHYPSGTPITYEFYDSTAKLIYFRKYNEDGSLNSKKGNGIIEVHMIEDSIVMGTEMVLSIVCAIPPVCKSNLEINTKRSEEVPQGIYSELLTHPNFEFFWKAEKQGNFEINFSLSIIDTITNQRENYTSDLMVVVY